MKKYVIIALCLFVSKTIAQKPMFDKPLSPRIANYTINVKLNDQDTMLIARQVLNWQNDSKDVIKELQFHLYMNAFKNEASTFMQESKGRHRRSWADLDYGWGWINISSMNTSSGEELTAKIEYIQPDDDNENDQTVIRVPLDNYIKPGQSIEIEIDFEVKLPKLFARTGYFQDFFMIGQWFPKIGVYEEAGERYAENGQWNCHQFHLNSEFFADYGVYDVTITVPQKYVVGATGVLLNEVKNEDGTKSLNYYCEDVHDFAWTADPDYVVVEDQWKHVAIKYLVQPQRLHGAQRYIQAVKNAFEYFEEWYGDYPYPTLTIVDPSYGGRGAGGMEYPTLITAGVFGYLVDEYKYPEMVTVHELAHNYWYGLVGSNEFEEAWLDEGITTYSELKVMEEYYNGEGGSYLDLLGLKISDTQATWRWYANYNANIDKIFNYSWKYYAGGYGMYSYDKPGMMLLTLHNYLGDDRMKNVMRTFFDRYKFKHPTTIDFVETVNEISGENLNWFFEQVIYGSGVLDYKINRISNEPIEVADRGFFDTDTGMIFIGPKELDDIKKEVWSDTTYKRIFHSKVIVEREGEVFFPVEVLIKFSSGEEILEQWDGRDRYKIFEYKKTARIISAEVDPDFKIWLDIDPVNNGKVIKKQSIPILKYSTRWFFWMQNLLHLFSLFS